MITGKSLTSIDKFPGNVSGNYMIIIKIIEMLKTTGLVTAKAPGPSRTTSGCYTHPHTLAPLPQHTPISKQDPRSLPNPSSGPSPRT